MLTRRLLLICLVVLTSFSLNAQDEIFSQFFAAPTQLNPALVGTTYTPRVSLNYRNQWPAIPNAYITYAAAYDQYIERVNSGFGVSIISDNAGDGLLKTTKIQLAYAYNLQVSEAFFIRLGLESDLVQKRLDWDRLIFLDQLDPFLGPIGPGGVPFATLEERPANLTNTYLDISTGLMAYAPWFYAGVTVKHINAPDESFIGDPTGNGSIPILFSFHAGAEINLGNQNNNSGSKAFISPNLIYARQGAFNQVNAGAYIGTGMIFGGAWFRHTFSNADAAIVMAGFKRGIFKMAYSYDITVSGLSSNTGGAHEVSFVLNFDETKASKIRRMSKRYGDCLKIFK